MVTAIAVLSGLALVASFGLAMIARAFAVPGNPKAEEVEAALPGANCGGCGLPGCSELARRIAEGRAGVDACPVGGEAVARAISRIMGVAFAGGVARKVALVLCAGDAETARERFHYNGIKDCASAALLFGGGKACSFGCLGLGTCAGVCPFGAIEMSPLGLPVVDPAKCTACNKCVIACPKKIIRLVPVDRRVHILCSSRDRGAKVRKVCGVGCIACAKCVKEAPEGAIELRDNLAVVHYAAEIPDAVASVCPMDTIRVVDLARKAAPAGGREAAGGTAS